MDPRSVLCAQFRRDRKQNVAGLGADLNTDVAEGFVHF